MHGGRMRFRHQPAVSALGFVAAAGEWGRRVPASRKALSCVTLSTLLAGGAARDRVNVPPSLVPEAHDERLLEATAVTTRSRGWRSTSAFPCLHHAIRMRRAAGIGAGRSLQRQPERGSRAPRHAPNTGLARDRTRADPCPQARWRQLKTPELER